MNDIEKLVLLNMVDGLGSMRTQSLLKHFKTLDDIFGASEKDLMAVENIGRKIASNIVNTISHINVAKEMKLVAKHNVDIVTFLDENYPKNLKNIYDPPIVLYVKGKITPDDNVAIAVVGSRQPSLYGLKQAEKISFELSSRGITIVSGLARGIDSSAHRGVLRAKGRTIAVLGSGILNIYPEEHKSLSEEVSGNGALISEFPMETYPQGGNFPRRNRIISGLSLGVVVVEAALRSGALITSDMALEQGREVFAVPGKVDSMTSLGTNKLIKEGAKLVSSIEDILQELKLDIKGSIKDGPNNNPSRLDKSESLVYTLLSSEPKHIDEILKEANIAYKEISSVLMSLQIKHMIKELPGKNFVSI
ncbi:MAG: DNA-processing protein DprA [Candidatus Omnitrophota bacterium]